MKKMLLFHHYNSSLGAGLSLIHILRAMNENEYEIVVCLPRIPGDLDKKINELGIRVIYIGSICAYMHFSGNHTRFLSPRHYENIVDIKKNKSDISKIISQEKPDIVAINSMTLFWIGAIAKRYGAKSVCFHRETYRKGLFGVRTAYMKKKLSTDFDVVAFLSNYDIEQTPRGSAKYVRITDKVDVKAYNALSYEQCREKLGLPQAGIPLILYAGGMAKLKGPEVLIKAIGKMKHTEAKLVFLQYQPLVLNSLKERLKNYIKILLGKNLQYKIEKYIDHHNLRNRIIFRPATDHVEEYFVACDAVVFPCCDVHQARPLYEAGVARKPIIITDFPNYREFVDETNGWLFPNGDSGELARCLDDAVVNTDAEKVERNYQRSVRDNNLDTMPRDLMNLLALLGDV